MKFIFAVFLNITLTLVAFTQIIFFVFVTEHIANHVMKYLVMFSGLWMLLALGWIGWEADMSYLKTPDYSTYKRGVRNLLKKDTMFQFLICGGIEAVVILAVYLR